MRKWAFLILVIFAACDELIDVNNIDGPCTIILQDGSSITSNGNIEIMKSTGVLTYRDQDGKLWSLTSEQYQSYNCGIQNTGPSN